MSEALVVEAAGSEASPASPASRQTEAHDEPGVTWRADELKNRNAAAINTVVMARLILSWRDESDARGEVEYDEGEKGKAAIPTRSRRTFHKHHYPINDIPGLNGEDCDLETPRSRFVGRKEGTERQATRLVTLERSYRSHHIRTLVADGLTAARRRNLAHATPQ